MTLAMVLGQSVAQRISSTERRIGTLAPGLAGASFRAAAADSSGKRMFFCGSFGRNRCTDTVGGSSLGNQAESLSAGFVAKFMQLGASAFRVSSPDLDLA